MTWFQQLWLKIARLFSVPCTRCDGGRVRHVGRDWTGFIWLDVYECDNCHEMFI